jgi:F-type H+-transporting ATPase subunit b
MAQRAPGLGSLLVAGALLSACPALAEEASQGLPQLNPAHFPEQLFWLAVTFALLYVMMRYVALNAVKRTQDTRADVIAADLAAAQAANDEAKALMTKYEKALADARARAQATVNEFARQAAQQASQKQANQRVELVKHLTEAEARIHAARDAALKDIKGTAANLAAAIIEKVTGDKSPVRAGK